jgi:hypothetical protein
VFEVTEEISYLTGLRTMLDGGLVD